MQLATVHADEQPTTPTELPSQQQEQGPEQEQANNAFESALLKIFQELITKLASLKQKKSKECITHSNYAHAKTILLVSWVLSILG